VYYIKFWEHRKLGGILLHRLTVLYFQNSLSCLGARFTSGFGHWYSPLLSEVFLSFHWVFWEGNQKKEIRKGKGEVVATNATMLPHSAIIYIYEPHSYYLCWAYYLVFQTLHWVFSREQRENWHHKRKDVAAHSWTKFSTCNLCSRVILLIDVWHYGTESFLLLCMILYLRSRVTGSLTVANMEYGMCYETSENEIKIQV